MDDLVIHKEQIGRRRHNQKWEGIEQAVINLRIPFMMQERLKNYARKDQVSLNTLINEVLATWLAFEESKKRGKK